MDKKMKSLITDSLESEVVLSDEKNILKKMAYCPTHMEDESIKRYYINSEEISEIFEKVLHDE